LTVKLKTFNVSIDNFAAESELKIQMLGAEAAVPTSGLPDHAEQCGSQQALLGYQNLNHSTVLVNPEAPSSFENQQQQPPLQQYRAAWPDFMPSNLNSVQVSCRGFDVLKK